MKGYMGRILRVDLSNRRVSSIETSEYADWVGGHGIGSALFWDRVEDKTISGFDPGNIMSIMTSPLTGTLVPSGSARTELQAVGVQSYPTEWFTRSNVGGRFGPMLKFAGWDGIVLEGNSEKPVWLDIRDESVDLRDAADLWGLDIWQTQHRIWKEVCGKTDFGKEWFEVADGGQSTQRPAVLAIGQAGEALSRTACIIHDRSHAAGQGGYGAVWGKKKLKAISVIGTKSVPVADPDALMEAWQWARERYSRWPPQPGARFYNQYAPSEPAFEAWPVKKQGRRKACFGCFSGCHATYADGKGSGGKCHATVTYSMEDEIFHGKITDASYHAVDLMNRFGLNVWEVDLGIFYLQRLYEMGELGPGKKIPCDLPMDRVGTSEFIEQYIALIVERRGIGDDLAEGCVRAAERWGRLEEDLRTGVLLAPYWGYPIHYDARTHVVWGYASILGERDVNEHEINWLSWIPSPLDDTPWGSEGPQPIVSAQEAATIMASKLAPLECDPDMLDFSDDNIYSENMAKLSAWFRHFTRFWRQSALFCDFRWSGPINIYAPGKSGVLAEAEDRFFTAVTGKKLSIVDGVELGRKIWNLDNAIWTLQGRHRDQVRFADHVYDTEPEPWIFDWHQPGKKDGEWTYVNTSGRSIDREKFEQWKTKYYRLEGWDPDTGWPTRKTLEGVGLKPIADELARQRRLGKA
jgi:aldehyde:ferredoxin oxidoreductase